MEIETKRKKNEETVRTIFWRVSMHPTGVTNFFSVRGRHY